MLRLAGLLLLALPLGACFDVPIEGGRCNNEHGCRADEACVEGFCRGPDDDAGVVTPDAGPRDAGPGDAGPVDAGADAGPVDGGPLDAGRDGGDPDDDGGPEDAGPEDDAGDVPQDAGPVLCGLAGEECTQGDGQTCWSVGRVQGAGAGLLCTASCTYDVAGCGELITSRALLQQAVDEALATSQHEVVALPGPVDLGTAGGNTPAVILDECSAGVCAGGRPFGLTLQPLAGAAGAACLRWGGSGGPALRLGSGANEIVGVCFEDVRKAIEIDGVADADGNTIRNCRFEGLATTGGPAIVVGSGGNRVVANLFRNTTAGGVSSAVSVSGTGNTVAMNLVDGSYLPAVQLTSAGNVVDHNTFRLTGGIGVDVVNPIVLCLRNNLILGDGTTTTGVRFANTTTMGDATACGTLATGSNVNLLHDAACVEVGGNDCSTFCAGGGPLCDLATDPLLDVKLCPTAGVIDVATDLGYDLVDGDAATFLSTAPELGAREVGAARSFGGEETSCP